jgi:hypothetical protein
VTTDEQTQNRATTFPALSKRGARRVIQRACVLVGRDRALRQNLREVELNTRWCVEDWGLEWTVVLDHGRVEFHRGRVGKPQVTYVWQTGEDFLGQVESGSASKDGFLFIGDPIWRRVVDPVFTAFLTALRAVLADPVDDDGVRLL